MLGREHCRLIVYSLTFCTNFASVNAFIVLSPPTFHQVLCLSRSLWAKDHTSLPTPLPKAYSPGGFLETFVDSEIFRIFTPTANLPSTCDNGCAWAPQAPDAGLCWPRTQSSCPQSRTLAPLLLPTFPRLPVDFQRQGCAYR